MTTLTITPTPTTIRPGRARRTAVLAAGVLACLLPTVFTVNLTRLLVTGELADHRFHQLTGQGLVLFAVWLVPLLELLRAGWAGRRPSTRAGYQHLALVVTGAVCSALAPGGGAPILVAVIAVQGALVWWALPRRPLLRTRVEVHPVAAPVALLACALLLPYAIDQIRLQNAVVGGHHAQNPHLFDMAWLAAVLMVSALLAAVLPAARDLLLWVGGACVVVGVAGLLLGEPATFSALAAGLGVAATGTRFLSRDRDPS